ncbi:uncharacterized protein LOC132050901 [Lycium ferocissimum]|uniref:uncharacterized protein LOC132050901 n=1 Tax=Lycium ferocissimum TaxID=112874 RepID=UPI002814BAC3|nr:uncharacterized protein LOC132050901 [Lycium ferocissimum]
MHYSLNPRLIPIVLILCSSLFLRLLPGLVIGAVVTLDSIEIYKKHELFGSKPTVFFQCKRENKTILPDVKKKHVLYIFKGEESWQPLTELTDKKCKRCGFYEKDSIKPDDTFDEWELCASDFTSPHGKYTRYLKKEFKATFLCPECVPHRDASNHSSGSPKGEKRMHWAFLLLICGLVSIVLILGAVTTYKCWKRKKRQHEQARFLKLFEEDDDIEDELGIGPLSHVM